MGNQSHLEKSRLHPGLSSMLTPVPLPPSACHAHSLSLNDDSAYESLSVLSIALSTLHLFSPSLSHSVHLPLFVCICWSFCLPVSSLFLHFPHTLHLFLSLSFSSSLTPFPYLSVSGSLASVPCLQYKQHLGNQSSWAREVQGGHQGGNGEAAVWGGGFSCCSSQFGEVGTILTMQWKEIQERAIPGAWAPSLGDGLGAGLGGRLKLPRRAGAGPGP